MRTLSRFYLFFITTQFCKGARILGFISTPSYSHQVAFQPLWKELSLRGHQVTVITTNPLNDSTLTNLTEIDTSFSYKYLTDNLAEIIDNRENAYKQWCLALNSFLAVLDAQLGHPPVKKLIQDENVHFDLIITEYILATTTVLSKRFNCPYIGVLSADGHHAVYVYSGNPTHPVLYPNVVFFPEKDLTLRQRVLSFLYSSSFEFDSAWYLHIENQLTKKHFGKEYDLREVFENVSLLFMKRDSVFHLPRPLNPNIILIGGKIERLPSKPLSKSLQRYLDDAEDGFIYFSLGLNVNSNDMPKMTASVIIETFQELPYKILWKYELDDLPEKPDNVLIAKWVPQLEVIKHPNIKLFITHGGAQSMEESIAARVPMLTMPFFADQPNNAARMVDRGLSLSVDYKSLEKQHFKATILELINNPKYKIRVKELADLAEDRPKTGLELSVWWTEYVLRHKGAHHLKSLLLDFPWYQYYYIDVVCLLILGATILFYTCLTIQKTICKVTNNLLFRTKLKPN